MQLIVLERIAYNYNLITNTYTGKGQRLIIDTLTRLTNSSNAPIKQRARNLINAITSKHEKMTGIKLYFTSAQINQLKKIANQTVQPQQNTAEDSSETSTQE